MFFCIYSGSCFYSGGQTRLNEICTFQLITSTQVMVYHWWIPCETLVHTGSR